VSSNITRRELKEDKFAVEVGHGVQYVAGHRKNFILYGAIALAVVVIGAGIFYYRSSQSSARNQELGEAIALTNAPVGQANPTGGPSFPTEQAKTDAVSKALSRVTSDYSGSEEAYVAGFLLAGQLNDAGKLPEARTKYQDVADHASSNYSSLAKLALAQIDFAEGKSSGAEALLKGLMDNPTDLVSKEEATLAYAKGIGAKRPAEARKLLTSLITPPSDVSPIASAALAELPQ
jgi:predicted negative regulator of RcsB-dependent stress response